MRLTPRLVDERSLGNRHRGRAARAAPRLPGDAAVEGRVQGQVAGREGTVGDDIDAVATGGLRSAVRPDHDVVVSDLALVLDRVPAGAAELRGGADRDAGKGLRRSGRAEAGRAVARREDRGRARVVVDEIGFLARRVVAVVVGRGGAVGVRRHVDPVPRGEQVAELRRELEGEVDISERSTLRLRRAADDGAGIRSAARAGLCARPAGEVGEARREAVDDALPEDVGRGERPVPLDRGVEVAGPGEHLARAERERVTELLRAVREAHDAARQPVSPSEMK